MNRTAIGNSAGDVRVGVLLERERELLGELGNRYHDAVPRLDGGADDEQPV